MANTVSVASPQASVALSTSSVSRRSFLAATSAAGGLAAGAMVHSSLAAAESPQEVRIAVIGCGGRGSGAINDSLAINDRVKLVAAADLYSAKCGSMRKALADAHPGKVDLDDKRMYGGLDGYKRVLDCPDVDLVLITTSPGFRPRYVLEAVEAGKHVFAEKPACVDPAGYRICLAAHEAAVDRKIAIVGGTQYRRQVNYIGAVEQIRKGGHRRRHRCDGPLLRGRHLVSSAHRRDERCGVPTQQLDALHLAGRGSDRGAGRP